MRLFTSKTRGPSRTGAGSGTGRSGRRNEFSQVDGYPRELFISRELESGREERGGCDGSVDGGREKEDKGRGALEEGRIRGELGWRDAREVRR